MSKTTEKRHIKISISALAQRLGPKKKNLLG